MLYLSWNLFALLAGLLLGHLDACCLWLEVTHLHGRHPALLHRLLLAHLLGLGAGHGDADLSLDIETFLMGGHGADWPGLLVTPLLWHLDLVLVTTGHGDVGAPLLGQLPGHGDDDGPGHVHALLSGGGSTHILLHRSLNNLVNCATSNNDTVTQR